MFVQQQQQQQQEHCGNSKDELMKALLTRQRKHQTTITMTSEQQLEKEAERLLAVRSYGFLLSTIMSSTSSSNNSTKFNSLLNDITKEVMQYHHVPWACITVLDMDHVWFVSMTEDDLGLNHMEREHAFCAHTPMLQQLEASGSTGSIPTAKDGNGSWSSFVIPDTSLDERFCRSNPYVTSGPKFRFYAGVPLISPEEYCIGTLCILDRVPHVSGISKLQREHLQSTSRRVMQLITDRRTQLRQQHQHQPQPQSKASNSNNHHQQQNIEQKQPAQQQQQEERWSAVRKVDIPEAAVSSRTTTTSASSSVQRKRHRAATERFSLLRRSSSTGSMSSTSSTSSTNSGYYSSSNASFSTTSTMTPTSSSSTALTSAKVITTKYSASPLLKSRRIEKNQDGDNNHSFFLGGVTIAGAVAAAAAATSSSSSAASWMMMKQTPKVGAYDTKVVAGVAAAAAGSAAGITAPMNHVVVHSWSSPNLVLAGSVGHDDNDVDVDDVEDVALAGTDVDDAVDVSCAGDVVDDGDDDDGDKKCTPGQTLQAATVLDTTTTTTSTAVKSTTALDMKVNNNCVTAVDPPVTSVAQREAQAPHDNSKDAKGTGSSIDLCLAPENIIIPRPKLTTTTSAETEAALPDYNTTGVDPDNYLAQLVEVMWGVELKVKSALELFDYFPQITEAQVAAYSIKIVSATRENNVHKIREVYNESGRPALDCFNRFGEGLLNMACRRGFKDIVSFLLSTDVALDVRVRDDYGRTPLHDACWNPEPQLEICTWLMEYDPSLFLVADKRGFTPFQYARKSDWHTWRKFLYDRRHLLEALTTPEILAKFAAPPITIS